MVGGVVRVLAMAVSWLSFGLHTPEVGSVGSGLGG